MSVRRSIVCLLISALLNVIGIVALCWLPFQSDRVELVADVISIVGILGSILLLIVAGYTLKQSGNGIIALAIVFVLFSLCVIIRGCRFETAERYRWDVHGIVESKYNDKKNHRHYTIEIRTDSGVKVVLRVSRNTWLYSRVGKRFEKDAWSPMAKIGNQTVRIID